MTSVITPVTMPQISTVQVPTVPIIVPEPPALPELTNVGSIVEIVITDKNPETANSFTEAFIINKDTEKTEPFLVKLAQPLPANTINTPITAKVVAINPNGSVILKPIIESENSHLVYKEQNSNNPQSMIHNLQQTDSFTKGRPFTATILKPENLNSVFKTNCSPDSVIGKVISEAVKNSFLSLPSGTKVTLKIVDVQHNNVLNQQNQKAKPNNNTPQPTQANNTSATNNKQQPLANTNNELTNKAETFKTLFNNSGKAETTLTTNVTQSKPENQNTPLLPKTDNQNPNSNKIIQQGSVITGTVIGKNNNGNTIVATNSNILTLDSKTNLAPETQITLEVTEVVLPQATKAFSENIRLESLSPNLDSETTIKTLETAIDSLSKEDPEALSRVLSKLPSLNNRFTINLANYLIAIKNGDATNILTEETAKIINKTESGKNLGRTLQRNIAQNGKKTGSKNAPNQTFDIPIIANNGNIEKISIVVRRPYNDDEESSPHRKNKSGKRFIVNINLSNFGEMQIDTLTSVKNKKIDIVIRNKKALPYEVAIDIGKIFRTTIGAFNYAGTLSFMVTEEFIEVTDRPQNNNSISDLIV